MYVDITEGQSAGEYTSIDSNSKKKQLNHTRNTSKKIYIGQRYLSNVNFDDINHTENMCSICSICTKNINCILKIKKKLSCGHIFHMDCIIPWLNNKLQCPYCGQIPVKNNNISIRKKKNKSYAIHECDNFIKLFSYINDCNLKYFKG